MFALKPRTEIAIRALLIAVILFNAFIPTTAIAMSIPRENEADSASNLTIGTAGMKDSEAQDSATSLRSSIFFRAAPVATPTETLTEMQTAASPTETMTPSPAPLDTASPVSATPSVVPATLESTSSSLLTVNTSPPLQGTPTASGTPIPTQTSTLATLATALPTLSTDLPTLSLEFLATPNQAKAGEHVTFTLKITNKGTLPVTGLLFSDTIPEGLNSVQSDDKSFAFDTTTRTLTWKQDPLNLAQQLLPGGSLTLTYTVLIESQVKDAEIIDTANVSVGGLKDALRTQTTLILLGSKSSRTALATAGGNAVSADGRIKLNLPAKSLTGPAAVLIEDLETKAPDSSQGETWLKFKLELQSLQPQETTVPTPNPDILENDRTVPLTPVEAQFNEPVKLSVSFDGLIDLAALTADLTPFLVTLDEASGTWVRVPLKMIDPDTNTITAELTHFSVWGVGIGSAVPQNGANVLLYDSPYSGLFTGRSHYSLPIWTPPGRNGMQPNLVLSYSSGVADGILGDVQAPWVGMGWNIDTVEIARKITNGGCNPCGVSGGSYGYENKFILLFNGVGDELIPDATTPSRYHTREESFLYVQRHNDNLGNNNPVATNATGEWWEVVKKDGTRWRLGFTVGSEQLAAMKDYPGANWTPTYQGWGSLGYAGHAGNVVALRWRADQVTDMYGNQMTFTYNEETRAVSGTSTNYDQANYLDTISYTSHNSGSLTAGYSVVFVRADRSTVANEIPTSPTEWDNWDRKLLDRIDIKYGTTTLRTYDLGYQLISHTDGSPSKTWQTTVLTSVAVSGGSTTLPTTTFSYVEKDNRAVQDANSNEWAYPRLATANNGWGSTTSYTYENDGRHYLYWYDWRVITRDITDSVNILNPMRTTFHYFTPCYRNSSGWCNPGDVGELVGYEEVNETTLDFSLNTFAKTVHYFVSQQAMPDREYERQIQDASGTVISQTNTTHTWVNTGLPTDCFFSFVSQVDEFLYAPGSGLVQTSRTTYDYDTSNGNLTSEKEYNGSLTLYRQTDYEYVTNTSALVWILNTLSRRTLKDANQAILSKQEYGYNGNLPGIGSPTRNKPDLSRVVNGTQTIDTKYVYDAYGNVIEEHLFKNYGSTSSQPSGSYLPYLTSYNDDASTTEDDNLQTYPTSSTNPLGHITRTHYDYGRGLPLTVTDPNVNTTTTTYDGLGRVLTVKYPGYLVENIKYTYPTPVGSPLAVTSPTNNKVKIEKLDEDAGGNTYRISWQFMDGLGRVVQTQSAYETPGHVVLTDTSYNVLGQVMFSGVPRELLLTIGTYSAPAPNWTNVSHNTNTPDALGRITSVTYPDATTDTFVYSGLRTTIIDRNSHQKVQENDAFGRLIKVEEYTVSSSPYATTNYTYDERDLLTNITDAADNQTTIHYNGFGRKDSMSDPDLGSWSYGYDVFGNLTSQTDARNCVTTVTYDNLNRPTFKSYAGPGACNSTPDVTYTYDNGTQGKGHRTGMSDSNSSTSWTYNALGQAIDETYTIEGTPYSIHMNQIDAFGRPMQETIPSNGTTETLTYHYTVMFLLSSLAGTNTYVSQVHHAPTGQVIDELLGNGLLQQSCYDANKRKTFLWFYSGTLLPNCTTPPASPRLNLAYSYQNNGNVSQIVDATRSETLTYTYDELNRLRNVSEPYYNNSYTYNQIGNIMSAGATVLPSAASAGYYHTCIVTTSGGVMCWGKNNSGQLGDGSTTQRTTPANVNGLTSGISSVSAGASHACALTTGGGVKCWGDNSSGQLGDNSTTQRNTPVDVNGLTSGVTAIATGDWHTCALTTAGGVKCWGENSNGQLGDNSTTQRHTPVDVNGLTSGVIAITAGGSHTCALLTNGGVKCWGRNGQGQLGDNSTTQRTTPVDVSGLTSGVKVISAGYRHTCAVTTGGGVKCWGQNTNGQLGDNSTTQRNAPVDVYQLTSGVAGVKAGGNHTCARLTSNAVKCWGLNDNGQLGDGTTTQHITPVNVSGITSGAVSMAIGYSHSCAIMSGNILKCWGSNSNGQLGNGDVLYSTTPSVVTFANAAYTYGDPAHKHAVTSLSTGESYTYDANGNMITRVEGGFTYTQTFDAENRLISVAVSGQTTQFIYDGDGNLVKKIKPDGTKTLYVGGIYEVDKDSGGTVTGTKTYYPTGGALRITTVTPPSNNLYYVLKDHLGSASIVMDSTGTILVGEDRFYPFGETRLTTGDMKTDKLFTGQRQITISGSEIYNYGARFYSPKLGRFLSSDTTIAALTNPQKLNHFSYAANNPLRYTDPTGHRACDNVDAGGRCITEPGGGLGGFGGILRPTNNSINGGSGSGSRPGGNHGGNSLEETLVSEALYEFFYNPYFGGGSSGCNTWILMNTNGDWCHHTIYAPQPICLPIFHCSPDEQRDYALRFQYPGQLPWMPVVGGQEDRYVMGGDFIPWPWLRDRGHILVEINGSTITNSTYKTHEFHQGQIDRTISGGYILTEGFGTNRTPWVAAMNQYGGPIAFEVNDVLMTSFSTVDQLSNGALMQWMNSIPPQP